MAEVSAHNRVDRLAQADLFRVLPHADLSQLTNSHIFVTGCTGFIGYWLLMTIACLNQQGSNIRVTGISRAPEQFYDRHPCFANVGWLKLTQADVRSFEFLNEPFDYVIHGATDTRPDKLSSAMTLLDAAINGTARVCQQAMQSSVKSMLVLSSGAAYENGHVPIQPGNVQSGQTYSLAKQAMEHVALAQPGDYHVKIARCFAFMGYLLPDHLAVAQFIRDAYEEKHIHIQGDGSPVRSYLYAADLAVWLLVILLKGRDRNAYDVGSNDARTIHEHAQLICQLLAPEKTVLSSKLSATTPSARQVYIPNISNATQELGLEVWTTLEMAIKCYAKMEVEHP